MVPNGPAENANANRLLISLTRHMVQKQLRKINESDVGMTPKELKELTDAVRNLADSSTVVYQAAAEIDGTIKPSRGEVPVDHSTDDINLDSIGPAKIPEIKPEQPAN